MYCGTDKLCHCETHFTIRADKGNKDNKEGDV